MTLAAAQLRAATPRPSDDAAMAQLQDLSPSLAAVLRPQAAYRWLLPYLSAITPLYIESTLRGALAGNHVQAWELFDLMPDTSPDVAACMGEYLDGVIGKRIVIEPYCEEGDEPTETALEKAKLISFGLRNMRPAPDADENDVRGTIRDILAARFHGQSVLEMDWMDGYQSQRLNLRPIPGLSRNSLYGQRALIPRSTYWVHPCCYAWDMNGRLGLRMALTDPRGNPNDPLVRSATKWAQQTKNGRRPGSMVEPPAWNWIASQPAPSMVSVFPPDKFLIGVMKAKTGSVLGGSCLRPLAWWWLAANFSADYLLNLAQLFGIPFRKATFKPGTSEAMKQEVRSMLQQCGSTGWALLPESIDLQFESATGAAGQSPQAFFAKLAEDQIRKVILRQTMTGGSTSGGDKGVGKSFGEVEQSVKGQCIQSGADYAASVLNQQYVPTVLIRNYGEDGDMECPTVRLVDDDEGGLEDAQRDQVLSTLVDMPDSYVRRKYRVPMLGKADKVCGVETGTAGAAVQQAQAQQDQMRAQSDAADQQAADAMQDQGDAPADSAVDGEDGSDDTGGGEDVDARAAVRAADAGPADSRVRAVTEALRETVEPMLARLRAIEAVEDGKTRRSLLAKFVKDHGAVSEAIAHDKGLAMALERAAAPAFAVRKSKV